MNRVSFRTQRSAILLTTLVVLVLATYFIFNNSQHIKEHLMQYAIIRTVTLKTVVTLKEDGTKLNRTPSFDNYTCDKKVYGPGICTMILGRITEEEHTAMIDDLREFVRLGESRNWTYWLHAGTLLGSWRHHGMIKWDTDIDILVDIKNRSDLIAAYDSLKDVFGYFVYHKNVLVFYQNRSIVRSSRYPNEKWPYVDIAFFTENATHIWVDGWPGSFSNTKHPKRDIFPLKKRPYEGMMIKAPRHPEDYMKTLFGDYSRCETHGYNHKKMAGDTIYKADCADLMNSLLPFVNRTTRPDGTLEEVLSFKNKTLHRVIV